MPVRKSFFCRIASQKTRFSLSSLSLLIGLIASCSQQSTTISREDCTRAREHQADLRVALIKPAPSQTPAEAEIELEKHRKNFSRAGGDQAIEDCLANHDLAWVECVIEAKDLVAVRSCTR